MAENDRNLFSHSSGGKSLKSRWWGGHTPPKGLVKNASLLLAFSGASQSLVCGSIAAVPASIFAWPSSLCVSISLPKFPSSCKIHSPTGCRAPPPSSTWPHLNLIPSEKIIFPDRVTFTGLGGPEFWRNTIRPRTKWIQLLYRFPSLQSLSVHDEKFSPPHMIWFLWKRSYLKKKNVVSPR